MISATERESKLEAWYEPPAVGEALPSLPPFLRKNIAGERPDGACDLMYRFTALQSALRRKEALENALKGNYGAWRNIDWLPADERDDALEAARRKAV